MRSPMMQNGRSEPMTTVLDRDWTTVSTHFPFDACRDAKTAAEAGDPGLAAEADQVQSGDTGQRPRMLGELTGDLEALLLGVDSLLAALDRGRRDRDARHVLVDEAEGGRRADEADRGQERGLPVEAVLDGVGHEACELLRLERDLELKEARAGTNLLQRTLDAVVQRRSARVLDSA